MDPATIAESCLGLFTAITKTILFIRSVIDAPNDQDLVTNELSNLQSVVRLLQDHSEDSAGTADTELIPEPIQAQILSIISSCKVLVDRIYERVNVLKRQGAVRKIKWVVKYKDEVADLRASLEAHRGSLGLAVQLISIPTFRMIRGDTVAIREGVETVRRDVKGIEDLRREVQEVRELVKVLAAPVGGKGGERKGGVGGDSAFVELGSPDANTDSLRGRAELLERYLDNLTSYTESVLDNDEMVSNLREWTTEEAAGDEEIIVWYGQVSLKPGQRVDDERGYFTLRERFADASYWGQWDKFIQALEGLEAKGHAGWVNCWRIKTGWGGRSGKGFTALHQAAWHGASKATVERLIELGAWRLSQTLQASESSPAGSTPFDVARRNGAFYLLDVLNPVVHHRLSSVAVSNLQRNLHDLIKNTFTLRLYPSAFLQCFVLPNVEILTEFETAGVWFPLEPEGRDPRGGLGVEIHLDADREELDVVMQLGAGERASYRVSKAGVWEV